MTKTAADLIGTAAAHQNIAAGGNVVSASRDVSGKIGIMLTAHVAYGAGIPGTDPFIEIITSSDDANYDTEAYDAFYVPRLASNTKQISFPLRFAEDVKYYKVKITNGATNAIDVWILAVEVAL